MLNKFTVRGKEFTILTLSNGKKVGNFSSPHEFKFTDGSILPAVSDERSIELSLRVEEIDHDDGDINIDFFGTDQIVEEIEIWKSLKDEGIVDIVFCPLPMMMILRHVYEFGKGGFKSIPFRAVYIEDRIEKKVSITRQCI